MMNIFKEFLNSLYGMQNSRMAPKNSALVHILYLSHFIVTHKYDGCHCHDRLYSMTKSKIFKCVIIAPNQLV